MNDQSAKIQPGMVHVHLSSLLPARAYDYLAAFLPGLFFVLSVALANPVLFGKIAAAFPAAFPPSQYVKLGVALFFAFVIGNGFMMGVSLIQWLHGHSYAVGFFLRRRLYSHLLPFNGRLIGNTKSKVLRKLAIKINPHLHARYYGMEQDEYL